MEVLRENQGNVQNGISPKVCICMYRHMAFICLAKVAAAYDNRMGWPNDFQLKNRARTVLKSP